MITFTFDDASRKPKYEQLSTYLKENIVSGRIPRGQKLPSKRKLAAHLAVALNTVENAYAQLLAEGVVESVEKKGYFTAELEARPALRRFQSIDSFPFVTWSRLMRDCLRSDHARLVQELHPQGDRQLREVIAAHLRDYRNMQAVPERIVIGAGTTYLLGMVTELLPRAKFAIEDPGYPMLARTLQSRRVPFSCIGVDGEGMDAGALRGTSASVCVATPSNQFPLCRVMSIKRRLELLEWADSSPRRYIVEDDYDSDYRYSLRPAPALHSLDLSGRVIYCNTFARTLTPSLRMAYMVLPPDLMETYRVRRALYSCTVSGFEQRTLLRFMAGGHYERHLNRMRTIYKRRRNALIEGLRPLSRKIRVKGTQAGLHFLIESTNRMRECDMVERALQQGVTVFDLSGFYQNPPEETHCVIAGYGGLIEPALRQAATMLCKAWK